MTAAADEAHAYAAKLDPATATPAEVNATLDLYRRAWWTDGHRAPGTIAWFLADFLPKWIDGANERAIELDRIRGLIKDFADGNLDPLVALGKIGLG